MTSISIVAYLFTLCVCTIKLIDVYQDSQHNGYVWYPNKWWKDPLMHLVLLFGKRRTLESVYKDGSTWLDREVTLGKATFWTRLKLIKKAPQL